MSETWNKRERERNKRKKRNEKIQKRLERKHLDNGKRDLESMLAYVDENGNLSSQRPENFGKTDNSPLKK